MEAIDKKTISNKEFFDHIYKTHMWGGQSGFYSGTGSHDEKIILPYIELLKHLIVDNRIERIVEIGCGDFNVMGQVLGYLWAKGYPCDYAGIDVVPDLVSYNESVFSRPGVHFSCADASQPETELPDGDLLIIRQVLQHLPNEDIAQILEKAKKYHYLLITEHIYEGDDVQYNIDQPVNFDTRLPKHSGVYLEQSPYNMQNIVHLLRVPQVGGMIRTSLVIQSSGK